MTEWSEQFWRWILYFHVTESINFAHNHMSGKIIGNKFNLAHYAAISLTHIKLLIDFIAEMDCYNLKLMYVAALSLQRRNKPYEMPINDF